MFQLFTRRWLSTRLKKNRTLLWILELFVLFQITAVAFTILFKITEKSTWMEAVWQMWQTATTVGYGNAPAQSVGGGRFTVMILGMLSIAILGSIISAVFDYREEMRSKRRYGLLDNPFKKGIVVFNFPGTAKFLSFERELRAVEPDVGICIIDGKLDELPQSVALLPKIHFIKGSILEESTFKKAGLQESKSVVIFPSDPSNPESDAITRVIIGLVQRFAGENTRIMYILSDWRNNWMFKDVEKAATPILDSLEVLALVQECQDRFSAPIVQQLLNNTVGANPITVKPNLIVGWTWGDLDSILVRAAKAQDTRVNTFALIKNGAPEACPHYSTVIEKDDYISLIAFPGFNWKNFEHELVRQKSGSAGA